jgi:hypothetical protein
MGMLFFGIMVYRVLRRKAGNVVARAQYPDLAKKLGLTYQPASFKDGVGRLEGTYDGYRVVVDPDDQRRIYLAFASRPAVAMHSYVHNRRSLAGQRSFRPASGVLAAQFKTAHASSEVIAALGAAQDLPETLRPLKFLRELKTLSVTESGVIAIFDYGNPPFIPVATVEDVLPRLVRLARVFDPPAIEGAAPSPSGAQEAASVS